MKKSHLILFLVVLVTPLKAQQLSSAKKALLYETKFEEPTFLPGNLAGQDDWSADGDRSQDAAKIVRSGSGQHLVISGDGIQMAGPENYCGAFLKAIQLDPEAPESPSISVSADFQLDLKSADSKIKALFAFLILADESGRDIESIGIDGQGTVFGQNWATPNQVVVASRNSAHTKHSLRVDFDFKTRQATYFMDKVPFGSLGFNPGVGKLPGFVKLVLQSNGPISSMLTISSLSVTRVNDVAPNTAGAQPAPTPGTQAPPSPADRIKQIKQLMEQGLIDKQEYDRRVKEILDAI